MRKLSNEELNRLSVEEFKAQTKLPIAIILDNVRSLNNVGSAFRTADAYRVKKIYLTGITGQPPHREINKTALGATQSVDWEYHAEIEGLISHLQQEDWQIVAIEQAEGSTYLHEHQINPKQKYALIFGNEVEGVKDKIVEEADLCLEIPQFGTKHSLNISVSMGVVVWDFFTKYQRQVPSFLDNFKN